MFPIDRAHACPTFEAYKLGDVSAFHAEQVPLTQRVAGSSSSAAAPLGFKELKTRAMHSPLATYDGTCGAYITENGGIILVSWSKTPITCTEICKLPSLVYSHYTDHLPSLCALGASGWLACGDTDTLMWVERGKYHWAFGTIVLPPIPTPIVDPNATGPPHFPWTLLQAEIQGDGLLYALLQRTLRTRPTSDGGRGASDSVREPLSTNTIFEVVLVCSGLEQEGDMAAELLWRVQCSEPVKYVQLAGPACLMGAEAPIEQCDDERPVQAVSSQTVPTERPTAEQAPYTWTQTDDTVMVALALPSHIRKEDIRAHFSLQGCSVSLSAAASSHTATTPSEHLLRDGGFTAQAVWGRIEPTNSVWDLETVGSAQLLTLHLAKAHTGTRWPHVFAHDDGVLETLDPSQLAAMAQGLAKYTQPISSSTLLHESLEEAGPSAPSLQLAWIAPDGQITKAAPDAHAFLARATPAHDPALLLQHDLDGHVFVPPSPIAWDAWSHAATMPAIGYVLASKREAHPVYMYRGTSTPTVLAAEPRFSREAHCQGSHVYVYGAADAQRGTSYMGAL
ncbi:hypothetical protein MNAN1_000403 [Malassezia nana]|uniref:NudC domain-containing protein 1 n=1 Tax=Malassezia nana TaxID=180528 RepID=A0AAF0EJD5_9BASI|nr:hypothetical protein MNAN1_000403 [Malassezia nana]